jgi:hypothetical protein
MGGDRIDPVGQPTGKRPGLDDLAGGSGGLKMDAIDRDCGHGRLADLIYLPVDSGEAAMQTIDAGVQGANLAAHFTRPRPVQPIGDDVDRLLELLQPIAITFQQADGERANRRRQLVAQHLERGRLLRCHQHAFALGQIVADDVGNGVCLAGPGRALHDDPRP